MSTQTPHADVAVVEQVFAPDRPTRGRLRRWMLAASRERQMPAAIFLIGYAFLLLCIPSQLIFAPLGGAGTPANMWGIAALLWWALATVSGLNPVHGFTPIRIGLALLVLGVLASYVAGNIHGWYAPADIHQQTDVVFSLVQPPVADVTEKMISAGDRGLLSFAGWTGVLLMTAEGLRSWVDLELLVKWICRFGAFIAGLGIVQYFTGVDIAGLYTIPGLTANSDFGAVASRSILNRVSSTAVHPIEFGVVMAALLLLALHRAVQQPRRVGAWVPVVLIGLALPMSISRSGILAAAIGGLIIFASWPPRWRTICLALSPFIAVGMKLMVPGLLGTIRSLFTNLGNDPSVTGRTDDYAVVFELFQDHAWFGRGLFTLVPRYYRILDNQVLMTLVELGVCGLVALLIFFCLAFLAARSARRLTTNEAGRHLALVLSAALVGVVISYLTFDALGFPMVSGLTFLLAGLAGATWQLASSDSAQGLTRTTASDPIGADDQEVRS